MAAKDYPAIFGTHLMPTPEEAYGVVRGAGNQLAAYSAPGVGQPMGWAAGLASLIGPFMDHFSNNAFSTNYRNKMLG